MIFAHRGGCFEVPENSMAGVENAIKNDWSLELDLNKTKDGKFILAHDANLKRLTG